ncbi:hypothetical protein [Vibrio parahaemolyticus]|uniref:hypothetical protein n=2 Tax=Vibrio parahaemolyticus TaxID=670 RepID=UPI00249073CC|nr:hypothetical protein [Vibrio parahaemolyticus]
MSYGITARDYLERARLRLNEGTNEALFYAAFEVRCGTEARMLEYLEVQKHISKKKRQGWQVAKLARNIEDAFRIGDKTAVLQILNPKDKSVQFEARYTPVRAELRKHVEKLGNYLHSAKKYHEDGSQHWIDFRKSLEKAIHELEFSTSGALLGPLLQKGKQVDMKLEFESREQQESVLKIMSDGDILMNISYEG